MLSTLRLDHSKEKPSTERLTANCKSSQGTQAAPLALRLRYLHLLESVRNDISDRCSAHRCSGTARRSLPPVERCSVSNPVGRTLLDFDSRWDVAYRPRRHAYRGVWRGSGRNPHFGRAAHPFPAKWVRRLYHTNVRCRGRCTPPCKSRGAK